jgi:hydroxymethylpyrimidine pyrophosphatase-like HAD family hydrolase
MKMILFDIDSTLLKDGGASGIYNILREAMA